MIAAFVIWRVATALLLAVAVVPVAFAQDTTPPELLEFNFNPATVDVTEGYAQVTFSGRAVDDLSGLFGYRIFPTSPSGQQANQAAGSFQADGTFMRVITIPQFSEAGTWTVSIRLL
jgi:hypothetical protein